MKSINIKQYLTDLEKILSDNWWITIIVILLLLFAPSSCNGITYYTGIFGCNTDNKDDEGSYQEENRAFFNMVKSKIVKTR